jgi:GT2 family glycosyltransferase
VTVCSETVPMFIVNYNGLESLGSTFLKVIDKAIEASTYVDNIKVILVDNGSKDRSADIVQERFWDTVTLLRLKSNLGHSNGVNVALKRYIATAGCTPRKVFVMDNDYMITNPEGLKEMLGYMEREKRTAAVQGVNLLPNGRVSDAGVLLTTFFNGRFRCGGFSVGECPEGYSYVSYTVSCMALYNLRIVLSKRDFLFNRHNIIRHDDVDLSLEMWSHGFTSAVIPATVGVHIVSSTRTRLSKDFIEYESKRGRTLLYRRASSYLKASSLLIPYIREIPYMVTRLAIYDYDIARIRTRAFLDALTMKVKPFSGPYEPLLIKPRMDSIFNLHRQLDKLSSLVVDRSTLMSSNKPFIINPRL